VVKWLELKNKSESHSDVHEEKPLNPPDTYDLDKEKVRMFWDYHKTRTYTFLTVTISVFVGLIVILNAVLLAGKVPYPIIVGVGYFATILYFPYFLIKGVWVKNKKLVIETDSLIQKLAKHEAIPPLKELLKVEEPAPFWEEYKKLFGWSRNRIIAVTGVLVVLIILAILGI